MHGEGPAGAGPSVYPHIRLARLGQQRPGERLGAVGELHAGAVGVRVGELARRMESALAAGVRWLIADLTHASPVSDEALVALVSAARELRARRGEMIVAGAPADVAARLGAWEVAHRPALAANVDQALMILKMLRPKTAVQRPSQRAKQRITSLTLPRVEPPGNPA